MTRLFDAVLCYPQNCERVRASIRSCRQNPLIARNLPLQVQLANSVTNRRMKEEHHADKGGKRVDEVSPPFKMRQVVYKERSPLFLCSPLIEIAGEEDHGMKYSRKNRGAHFRRIAERQCGSRRHRLCGPAH